MSDPWELASGARKQGEPKKKLRLAGVQPNAVHTLIKLHNWRSRAIYVYHLLERDMKRIDKPTEEEWMQFSSVGVPIPYPSKDMPASEVERWIEYGKGQAAQLGLKVQNPNTGNRMNFLRISDHFSSGSTEDRFSASVSFLRTAVGHATFLDGLDKHWKRHETRENAVMPQSWCWLCCWAMSGDGSESAKDKSRKAFEAIFHCSNLDSINVDSGKHGDLRELRYAWGRLTEDVERELWDIINDSGLDFASEIGRGTPN